MIFKPDTNETAAIAAENPAEVERRAYLLGLERAWFLYIRAERQHPVFAPRRRGVKYHGYVSLNEYLSVLGAQNAIIKDALEVLTDIRMELYGNDWVKCEAA